jgi:hypothetical protein
MEAGRRGEASGEGLSPGPVSRREEASEGFTKRRRGEEKASKKIHHRDTKTRRRKRRSWGFGKFQEPFFAFFSPFFFVSSW